MGAAAAKWEQKILHPPQRLDKLGVKAVSRVALVSSFSEDFTAEISARNGNAPGSPRQHSDLIFVAAEARTTLNRFVG
ncbi:MAG: hypothetical protein ABIZ80_20425 [Bryobacteraceae bacterium]